MRESSFKPVTKVGRSVTLLATFAVTGFATALAIQEDDNVVRIAVERGKAPGTGERFIAFDEPMVNESGDVAFNASFGGNGFGVFFKGHDEKKGNDEGISLVAKTGEFVNFVGRLSLNGDDFDGPKINDNGTVLFVVRNITNGRTTAAVFQKKFNDDLLKLDNDLKVILKQGDPAPGTNNGVFVEFDDMDQNNHDDVAIIATYTEDGGMTLKAGVFLITAHDGDRNVDTRDDLDVEPILLHGDFLPGTGGAIFNGTNRESIDGPWLNDKRVVVFQVDDLTIGAFSGSVFAKEPDEGLEAFVLIGEPLPPSFGGGNVTDIVTSRPAFNNSNQLGFNLGETFIVTKKLGGTIMGLVPNGTRAPRTHNGFFNGFSAPTINNEGFLQFSADVTGDPVNDRGIFVWNPERNKVEALVLRGDPKPKGGHWSFELEEGSISDGYVVFLDETPGAPSGVFRVNLPKEPDSDSH